jgi:dienelactone hydrolase
MKQVRVLVWAAVSMLLSSVLGSSAEAATAPSPARVIALKAADGVTLKASYFAAARPGPGVLLLQQGNRDRKDWDGLAQRLARAGINTLTLDLRGYGDSEGTPHDKGSPQEAAVARSHKAADLDMAFEFLASQPGVRRDDIGLTGAGAFGVDNAVQLARRHPGQVKSLVLISGETFQEGLKFLAQSPDLPQLYIVAGDDEYPPTVEAMEWLYIKSSSLGKQFLRYPGPEAPWRGFEGPPWLPATGRHGTDLFPTHPELLGAIVRWCETTLIRTPGHAPTGKAEVAVLPSQAVLKQLDTGGAAEVGRRLAEVRRRDPKAQPFPEIIANIIGEDDLRAGDAKSAIEVLKLVTVAYPRSADAFDSLGDAYLAAGEIALARQSAETALTLLGPDTPKGSMWQETEERRTVIRQNSEQNLKKLQAKEP